MAEVAKMSIIINIGYKYRWAISNIDMDAARNLGLINVRKYWRFIV